MEIKDKYLSESGINVEDSDIVLKRHPNIKFDKSLLLSHATNYIKNIDKMLEMNKGLFFVGDTGSGKTISIVCILLYILDKKLVPVYYVTANDRDWETNPYSFLAFYQCS